MGELEDFGSEDAPLDLEALDAFDIFDIREIAKRFEAFRNKGMKRRLDYEELIQYEMNLLRILQKKVSRDHPKRKDCENLIAQHISKIFTQATTLFSDDMCMWSSYLKFLDRVKLPTTSASKKLGEMLRANSHKPLVWKVASDWEFKQMKNIKNARQFLLRGLRVHPESRLLYTEAFRMELIHADRLHKQLLKRDSEARQPKAEEVPKAVAVAAAVASTSSSPTTADPSVPSTSAITAATCIASTSAATASSANDAALPGPSQGTLALALEVTAPGPIHAQGFVTDNLMNQVLEGMLAERMYDLASKKIDDVSFHVNLLNMAQKYHNFTEKLQSRIVNELLSRYAHQELTWDTMARRELDGLCYSPGVSDVPPDSLDPSDEGSGGSIKAKNEMRERIRRCNAAYQFGCTRVNTQRMWSMYLDALIQINQDPKANLPNYKRNLLGEAFEKCHNAHRMEEHHYYNWIKFCVNKKPLMAKVLDEATKRFPSSEQFWERRLCFHLQEGNESESEKVFREAIKQLGVDSKSTLPLRKTMILYWQIKSSQKVEEFFKEGVLLGSDVSSELKPMYLDWLTLSKDIRAARETYQKLSGQPPFCLMFHQKMISLESVQPDVDLERIRKCYMLLCTQFGKKCPDVWMEFVKFEMKKGDIKRVEEIRDKATETLDPFVAENWLQELCLVTNCVLPVGREVQKEHFSKGLEQGMEVDP